MSQLLQTIFPEPERYELAESAADWEWTRREFFRLVGGGVIVALLMPREGAEAQPPGGRGGRGGARPQEIGAWIHIGEDSSVAFHSGKVEIGQNIRTSLAQAVAEELRVPAARVRAVLADTALVPPDSGTAGSRSTPDMAVQLRRAAAAARETLLDLAAKEAGKERGRFRVAGGRVVGPDSLSFEFGQLTRGQKIMKLVAAETPTTPASQWTVAGTSVPKVDGRSFVTGAHAFASDIRREGMLFGRVLRPAAFRAALAAVDTKAAQEMAGVIVVRDGDFVGVAAPTAMQADQALEAIKAEWKTVPQVSSEELFAHLKRGPGRGQAGGGGGGFGGRGGGSQGSIAEGLKAAAKTLEASYTIAYIAHVPMEPRAAVAEWRDGKLTVWTGTQMPFRVRDELARTFSLAADQVRVIVPDMGSGYGGKHTAEVAVEAARLARGASRPVKLIWTREEEFTWAYFRPAGVIDIRAGAADDGALTAWEFHNYNSGGSAIDTPYQTPNRKVEFHAADSPLRQGSYRALASTANVFARESHMDDLARAVGMDPLAFRLRNLPAGRLRSVLEAAAQKFGWGQTRPATGRGFGLACGTEKGSYVATCAEVEIVPEDGQVRVVRAVSAFECGAIVNPDHLKNQVEGCMMMGLGGALFERIEFAEGKIANPSLAGYRVPRFRDLPATMEVVLLNRPDLPSAGAGETPIVGIAPAIGNAIAAATGVRLRSLPLAPNGVPRRT